MSEEKTFRVVVEESRQYEAELLVTARNEEEAKRKARSAARHGEVEDKFRYVDSAFGPEVIQAELYADEEIFEADV